MKRSRKSPIPIDPEADPEEQGYNPNIQKPSDQCSVKCRACWRLAEVLVIPDPELYKAE